MQYLRSKKEFYQISIIYPKKDSITCNIYVAGCQCSGYMLQNLSRSCARQPDFQQLTPAFLSQLPLGGNYPLYASDVLE